MIKKQIFEAKRKKYFPDKEFLCKCGCGGGIEKMSEEFLQKLIKAREIANIPFPPVSYYRCPKHNAAVGSTSNNHPRGEAGDIGCTNSINRYKLITALLQAGFNRIGVHRSFIHCDVNKTQVPNVIWFY